MMNYTESAAEAIRNLAEIIRKINAKIENPRRFERREKRKMCRQRMIRRRLKK